MFFQFAAIAVSLIFATAMLGIVFEIVKAALTHKLALEKIRHGYLSRENPETRGGRLQQNR
jgi:hypothetical protein